MMTNYLVIGLPVAKLRWSLRLVKDRLLATLKDKALRRIISSMVAIG